VVDLTGKPKALFLVGLGGTGKTMLARWMGWRMVEQGRAALIAALDPQNRTLADWFAGVAEPETSDMHHTARWARDVLDHLMAEKISGLLDFGGGDVSLLKLVDMAPDLAGRMVAEGVEPVACYCLGPRVDDLTPLQSLREAGFRPRSTLLILNEGRVDSTLSREDAFARVLRHGDLLDAVRDGGVSIWMPRLEPDVAARIEGKRLTFGMARDGLVPEGAALVHGYTGGCGRSRASATPSATGRLIWPTVVRLATRPYDWSPSEVHRRGFQCPTNSTTAAATRSPEPNTG
jgi:hypothetical protein